MWTVHVVCDVEAWRAAAGPRIPAWLAAVGEIEALSSLACYGYEHPSDPFPALEPEGPMFEADGLGHPLIADNECVRNSVHLTAGVPAWIVSGSNMSGKSTLLRTVGVNAVLAQAGAPVRARSLRLGPCAIGATIRIQDSLHGRTSRFYTEIRRLKQIRDIADGDRPLLYLLDEIFHGTNSHDRQVGAAALLREFIEAGAMGLMVTHDLAIAEAAEEFGGKVRNVHFVDSLRDGTLSFDYTLRDGIVERSNAIELMRAVGLEV
jgi:DNA mismatch repair ATPase MutS